MANNNHEESEKVSWKNIEGRTDSKDASESAGWTTPTELAPPECPTCGYRTPEPQDGIHGQERIPNYIAVMQKAMEEWYMKPREIGHVTDIVMCPRQRVYREMDRVPIDAKTVSIYSAGKAIHEAIQWLFLSDKRTFEREKYIEYQDIQGAVDIYDRRRNIPLEFKTTRASDIREPKSFHVEQLKYYMSILSAKEGYMIYQLLMHFKETPFKSFRVTMNAQERRNQREKLVKEINSLKKAMEARDPSLARSVEKDPSLNWLCTDCPYLVDCKKIQLGASAAA
jgi:CRISPR/Cas system-associated exonuclease Cas4 (RecB family)